MSLHALRHSDASLLLADSVDLATVSARPLAIERDDPDGGANLYLDQPHHPQQLLGVRGLSNGSPKDTLFQVVAERTERAAVVLTTNLPRRIARFVCVKAAAKRRDAIDRLDGQRSFDRKIYPEIGANSLIHVERNAYSVNSRLKRAYAERVIGSLRRECLDHLIVLGESSF